MDILVTGANGQLGRSLRRAVEGGTSDRYHFTDVEELDITDREAVMAFVKEKNIGFIVNCASYTNVDKAESDYECAELINSTAVGYLAEAMKAVDGTLLHISTDYIFGGGFYNTPISEDVGPSPTGVYGLTKLHGEEEITKSGAKAIVIRTSWLYSEYGKNFVKTMLSLMETHPEVKVVIDQTGSPTYAGDLAQTIFDIIEKRKFEGNEGTYHYSNEGVCSWFDFATEIRNLSGLDSCEVLPCLSSEFPSPVKRPAYSVLDKTKIKSTFSLAIPHWRAPLKKHLLRTGC